MNKFAAVVRFLNNFLKKLKKLVTTRYDRGHRFRKKSKTDELLSQPRHADIDISIPKNSKK